MRRNILLVVLVALVSLGIFWAPWLMRTQEFWGIRFGGSGMETIVANFDGLNFLVVAKSLYDPSIISEINETFPLGNEPIYFSAHYPLFGLVIWFFSLAVSPDTALLLSIVFSNILLAVGLYGFFATVLKNQKLGLLTALVALFLPARILSDRAVGSNEPLFMFFVLTSLTMAYRGKHWLAATLGSLAILTRSPGILLFGAYGLAALVSFRLDIPRLIKAMIPYLLMPLTLILLFVFYGLRYGDFFAYFNSGDNIHLLFPPFMIFSNIAFWVNGMWREDLIYIYLFLAMGIVAYIKQVKSLSSPSSLSSEKLKVSSGDNFKKLAPACFGVVYGLILLFVSHRDLARYSLPVFPIAILGYAPLLLRKEVKIILLILIVPAFLLGWQFVVSNVQPINDWGALL